MVHDQTSIYSCLLQQQKDGRWFFAMDMNCDGVFSISDVAQWLLWIFFAPGDFLLSLLMKWPEAATFLELSPTAYSGWISGTVSAIVWLIMLKEAFD